ncbi:MAG: hypothetical protein NC123_06020 [Butyrivibrio sp.]|nr:hypothetical protein [Acetatifactor muris]MCM1559084.1 hypothetical protein [Butyrivibrio sp.]
MEYLTTCYRRQGESGCSLLLQQFLCRRTPVCFACLCTAESSGICRDTAESLLNWSRGIPWHRAAARPALWLKRFEKELTDITDLSGGAARRGRRLTLLLGVGEELLALGGGQNLFLLSTSFGRGRAVELPGQFRGCLEAGAGLLLATDGFLEGVDRRSLEETLGLREIRTEEQAERRLKELAASGGQTTIPGKEPAAAILLAGKM